MSIKVSTIIIIIIIIIIIKAISPSHATEPKNFIVMIMMMIIITFTLIYPPKCNNYYFLHPIANLDHCSEEANNTENKLNPSLWKAQTEQNHLQYFWLHCTNLQPNFHMKKGVKNHSIAGAHIPMLLTQGIILLLGIIKICCMHHSFWG